MITVVYPTRINKKVLRSVDRLKESIIGLRSSGNLISRIIIVDDNSDEVPARELVELAKTYNVELYRSNKECAWCKDRILNVGMKMATTEYVMCCDIDIITTQNFWEEVKLRLAPDMFLMGFVRNIVCAIPATFSAMSQSQKYLWLRAHSRPRGVGAKGGVQIFTKAWFDKVRGYDEDFVLWGHDDIDMYNRARRSGLKAVWVSKNITIFHIPHVATRKILGSNWRKNQHRARVISPKLPIERNPSGYGELNIVRVV